MEQFQFSRALLHILYDLDRFKLSLQRLSSQDFPSNSITGRIKHLESAIVDTEKKLESIEKDFSLDPQGASDRLLSEYRKLVQNRQQLEVLNRARSDDVPWSLVPSIEKLAEQLLPGKRLLITSTPDMKYMVGWAPNNAHPFVTVYLPALHRGNAFLHILIGHELFHPIVDTFVRNEQAKVEAGIRDECKKLIGPTSQPLFDQQRLDQVVEFTLKAWNQGLTELMCDMGAVALFGPAALWSISSFASTRPLDSEPSPATQLYPSWRFRLRTAIEYLKDIDDINTKASSLAEKLRKAGYPGHAAALVKGIADEDRIATLPSNTIGNKLVRIAYDFIAASLAGAKSEIKRLSDTFPEKWTSCLEEVPALIGRLQLLVPPCEIIEPGKHKSKPARLAAILIACWIERLNCEGNLPLEKYREICRLTLKAIEDSDLKSEFIEWKGVSV